MWTIKKVPERWGLCCHSYSVVEKRFNWFAGRKCKGLMKGCISVKSYLECYKGHLVSNSDGPWEYQKAGREVFWNSCSREVSNINKDLASDCAWSSSDYAVGKSMNIAHALGTWWETKFKGNRLINFVEKTSRQPRIQIGTWILLALFMIFFN